MKGHIGLGSQNGGQGFSNFNIFYNFQKDTILTLKIFLNILCKYFDAMQLSKKMLTKTKV